MKINTSKTRWALIGISIGFSLIGIVEANIWLGLVGTALAVIAGVMLKLDAGFPWD